MKGWIKLIVSFLLVWCFVKYAPKILANIDTVQRIVENSERFGIDNSALFYSEEPLTSKAELVLSEKMK